MFLSVYLHMILRDKINNLEKGKISYE